MLLPPDGKRKVVPPNLATRDHLRSRLDPTRHEPPKGAGSERRIVLACWKCNGDRARHEQLSQPVEELWRRAGRYPQELRRPDYGR